MYPGLIYFFEEMGASGLPSVQVEVPFQFSFTFPRVNSSTIRPTKTAMVLRNFDIMLVLQDKHHWRPGKPQLHAFLPCGN